MTRLLLSQRSPLFEEMEAWLGVLNNTIASHSKNQVPKINAYKKMVKIPHEKKDLGDKPKYCIDAVVPYATKEEINVSIEDRVLTIEVESHQDKDVEEGNYIIREIPRGSMKRVITLGELIDTDSAVSTFENGVLHIEFDEAEPKAKKIEIM